MSTASDPTPRIKFYVGAVIASASVVFFYYATRTPVFEWPASTAGVLTFLLVGLGLELAEHRLTTGSATGSIAFIVYMGAALVFGPTWCAIIAGTSIALAQTVIGKRPFKIAFNVAQNVLALTLGTAVYLSLGGEIAPTSLDSVLLPYAGFVVTYFTLNSSAVSAAIALSEDRPFGEVWLSNTVGLAAYDLMASVLGLGLASLYLRAGILGVFLVVLPIVFVRHVYAVNVQLQSTNRELLDLMVKAIEARDPYTSGHSQRVAELARMIARHLRLPFKEIEQIATSALLHDVGKIYEEFAPILRKEGRLTDEEMRVMKTHSIRSAELVGTISSLRGYVYKSVRHHHEDYDGSGYPDGLRSEQIPFGARIIRLADTVDAMMTDRPYRKALGFERVIEELDLYSGRQFDPTVVAAFKSASTLRKMLESRSPKAPFRERQKNQQLAVR